MMSRLRQLPQGLMLMFLDTRLLLSAQHALILFSIDSEQAKKLQHIRDPRIVGYVAADFILTASFISELVSPSCAPFTGE
jgi:hypothetical protein